MNKFQEAVNSQDWDHLVWLAEELRAEGQRDQADQALGIASRGGFGPASHNLAEGAFEAGDLVTAERMYTLAVEQKYWPSLANLGRMAEDRGDVAGARSRYRQGAQHGDETAVVNLAILETEEADYEAATSLLEPIAEQNAAASWVLGDAEFGLGRLGAAEAAYSRAMQLGELRAGRELAKLQAASGREEEAIVNYQIALTGNASGVREPLVKLLRQLGRHHDADAIVSPSDK